MERVSPAKRLSRWVHLTFLDPWQIFGSLAFIGMVLLTATAFAFLTQVAPRGSLAIREFMVATTNSTRSSKPIAVSQAGSLPAPSDSVRVTTLSYGADRSSQSTNRPPARHAPPGPAVTPSAAAIDSPPTPSLKVSSSGLSIKADASGSTDSDSSGIVSYLFYFGDGNMAGPRLGSTATWTYDTAGTYTVTVIVTDSAGLWSKASLDVTVP